MDLRFGLAERLVSEAEFRRVFGGRRLTGQLIFCYYRQDHDLTRKAGFVVGKKVSGKAVVRNRVKRRLRAIYREHRHILPENVHVVLRAMPPCAGATYRELQDEVLEHFKRIAR